MSENNMILAYRASSESEAALLVQALEAAGVDTVRAGGAAALAFGDLPADSLLVDIWIPKDKAELARRTIEGIQSTARHSEPEWNCATCGESNEGEFELCWNCRTPRG